MSRRDTVAAVAVLLFAAVGAVESARLLPFGVVRNPGPGFFPWWMSLALAFLALVLLGQSLLARDGTSRSATASPGRSERRPGESEGGVAPFASAVWGAMSGPPMSVIKVAGVLAVLAAYSLGLDVIGYPIATFLVVLFMLRVTEPHRWPLALTTALLAAGGSYVVFALWLDVPLPAGPFGR